MLSLTSTAQLLPFNGGGSGEGMEWIGRERVACRVAIISVSTNLFSSLVATLLTPIISLSYRPAQPSKVEHWMDYKEIEGWALIRGGLARDQEGSQPWAVETRRVGVFNPYPLGPTLPCLVFFQSLSILSPYIHPTSPP